MSDYTKKIPYDDNFYKHMYFDLKTRLPDEYLTKVDRMSMANSLETRAPFLDYRLIAFLTYVDKDIKVENLQTKAILRKTIGKELPEQLFKTRKMGFVAPLDEWFRTSAGSSILRKMNCLNWNLNKETISRVIERNRDDSENNGLFLWQLLVLGAHYEGN